MKQAADQDRSTDEPAKVVVDGLPFVACDVNRLAAVICARASNGHGGWVVTPNVDILRRWRREPQFRDMVKDATFFTADGAPIVWASSILGTPLPARLTGSDLFVALYKLAAKSGLRIALIGGNPGVAEVAVQKLEQQASLPPQVARTLCPPIGFERSASEMAAIEALLRDWKPHVVFVGLGSPKQEKLIRALRPILPKAWYLGVGVSFSFVAGDVTRAPVWLQRIGLEWLHRLIQEPGRLAARYLKDGLPFVAGLLARSAMKRWQQ